jgi:circadian clock protein KaiB
LTELPQIFKGIALFTPGGDLIYGIDPRKLDRWHGHLCLGLQERLELSEPPHFLVPRYTATVEKYLDPATQTIQTIAEIYPAAKRYIPLLNKVFELNSQQIWQIAPWQEDCNPYLIETYRSQFPQLWAEQDLLIRFDPKSSSPDIPKAIEYLEGNLSLKERVDEVYSLHLFISSEDKSAEQTLANIHQLLENGLTKPYTLKIIDITKNREAAATQQVWLTPTLIKVQPQPVRKIVGDLDDIEKIIKILN